MESDKGVQPKPSMRKPKLIKTLRQSRQNFGETAKEEISSKLENIERKKEANREKKRIRKISPMAKAAPGNITGPVFLIVGLILLGACLGFSAVFYFMYHRSLVFIGMVFIVPFIMAVFLLFLGIKQNHHADIYASYRALLKKKPYVSIEKLSNATHQSPQKVIKNLKVFKNEGLFPQGYFTDDKKYFVLSEGAQELLEEELRIENKERIKKDELQVLEDNYPKLYKIYNQIAKARLTVDELETQKSALRKPQLHDDLVELDYNLKQIQNYILKKPDTVPDLRNFLDYFLPMVRKLLNTYCELDKVKIRTDNVIESQNEIEDVLKTVNKAFKNMYNDFYTGTAMDVYADIQVLKTMISKNGFKESDFEEVINE